VGAADGLGDGALHPGTHVVAFLPRVGLLLGTMLFEDLLLLAGQQGKAAAPLAVGCLGAPRSQWACVTGAGGPVR
jgi:hypothetical protein